MRIIYLVLFNVLLTIGLVSGQIVEKDIEAVFDHRHAVVTPEGTTFELSLEQLKGKIVVLDFWNRYCVSCIRQMPKLYALQGAYRDSIVILPVTAEVLEDVKKTFQRQLGGQYELKLPTIYADSILTTIYSIQSYPEAVWLDRNGGFLAKTAGSAVNADMIRSVVKGDLELLDRVSRISRAQFHENSGVENKPDFIENSVDLFSVRVTPYNRTLSSDYVVYRKQISKRVRYALVNRTLDEMVKSLYSNIDDPRSVQWLYDIRNRRIEVSERVNRRFKTRDSLLHIKDFKMKTLFRENNLFCLFVEAGDSLEHRDLNPLALQSLEKAFGIKTGLKQTMRQATVVQVIPERISISNSRIELRRKVSLRKVSDLLNYINNKFVEESLWVLADPSAMDRSLGLVLDKTKNYRETVAYLHDIGFRFDVRSYWVEVLSIE